MAKLAHRTRGSAFQIAVTCALAACSDSDELHVATPIHASRSTPPSGASDVAGEFFNGRVESPPSGHAEFVAHLRAEADAFPGEAAALSVESQLTSSLLRCLRSAEYDRAAAEIEDSESKAAVDFSLHDVASVHTDEWISIRRARFDSIDSDFPSGFSGGERLAKSLREWLGPLSPSEDSRVVVRVDGVDRTQDGALVMSIEIRLFAALADARVQQNVAWRSVWTEEHPPRLRLARFHSFEEARARDRPLTDVSAAAFGALPFYVDELWRGSDELIGRRDRLGGESMLAMHGIAVGDVDGDGVEDVFVPQPAAVPNRLLLHKADGRVVDVSAAAGVDWLDPCSVALILDLDGDGHRDLAVSSGSSLVLSWNDGEGRFPTRELLTTPDSAQITALTAADADGDGDLDLYAGRYAQGGMDSSTPVPYHDARNGAANVFWRNEGERRFRIATSEVGLDANNSRFTQALLWDDLDDDGDPDLCVVNDFGQNNLYRNDGGKFTDVAESAGFSDPAAGMGASSTDVDLDGDMDLYVSNMDSPAGARIARSPRFMPAHHDLAGAYVSHASGNALLLNRGDGTFTCRGSARRGGWSWGAVFFDLDDDGLEDLYVPNGFVTGPRDDDLESCFWRQAIARSPPTNTARPDYLAAWSSLRYLSMFDGFSWNGHERKFVYLNLGDAEFADVSAASGADDLGDARGCAVLDWNDDGRMDLLLRNRTRPRLRLLLNTHPAPGHFLSLELAGASKNVDAIGAHVWVEAGGKTRRQSVVAAEGFMSAPSRRLVFGLGAANSVERVRVRWPDRTMQEFGPLEADARYRLAEGQPEPVRVSARVKTMLGAEHTSESLDHAPPLSRIVLSARLPMRAIELERFDHSRFALGELAGKSVILCLWSPSDPASNAMIDALGAHARELAARGVEIATIVRANANALEPARTRLRSFGLDTRSGPANKRALLALEIAMIEVLGAYDKLPLPLVLLLDRGENLVALHCGAADFDRVLADASRIAELNPTARSTEKVLGGRWLYQPRRDLSAVADVFERLGERRVAESFRESAATRD